MNREAGAVEGMGRKRPKSLGLLLAGFAAGAAGGSFEADVKPLLETSCILCHQAGVATPLDIEGLGFDLADPATFRAWGRIYERVENGEMPPVGIPLPEAVVVETAMASLERALVDANLAVRGNQRTPLRRLTRLEYAYTIQDLLRVDEAVGSQLSQMLPAEADAGGFDTVAENQGISPLHVRSYLAAADRALDAAIVLGPRPATERHLIEYANSPYLDFMHEAKILGGGVTMKQGDAVATFFDTSSTYLFHTESEGFAVPWPGRYRVTVAARPYQARSPVTLTLYRGTKQGSSAALNDLLGAFDLLGDALRTVEVTTFLRPGDLLSPSVADLDPAPGTNFVDYSYFQPDKNVRAYRGEGIAIKSLAVEGPLLDAWPPDSSRHLLAGVAFDESGRIQLAKAPYEHIVEIVERFAPLAFRRPLYDGEADAYASLAKPLLAAGRPFLDAVRIPLRAILSTPPFLFQAGDPGALDDFALAARLSYFLWRSMPDALLFDLAAAGRLSEPAVLAEQVERLLGDAKAERFVKDFAGQALRLYELKATNPDPRLYPEYDDRLGQAMAWETELFLTELIAENHGVGSLIDADFTFLNRRLAEHYGISGVEGQPMRQVALPADSVRGGLLTQASILKITANGTVTSPVPRGNFVLANLLGRPAPPPPPGVAGLEPDTRGTTTIREQLTAHRANPVCASCHRSIDPPGFALESFDPIGGFRSRYRTTGSDIEVGNANYPGPYQQGPAVDASGVTPDGDAFSGIEEYKALLMRRELDQVARHFASQLAVFATGAEIEFADRDAVERMVAPLAESGYPVRSMIHRLVQSELFRNR